MHALLYPHRCNTCGTIPIKIRFPIHSSFSSQSVIQLPPCMSCVRMLIRDALHSGCPFNTPCTTNYHSLNLVYTSS